MSFQEFLSFVASLLFLGGVGYLFSQWQLDRLTLDRYRKILTLAEEAVLFVEDAFPEKKGTEKLKEAIRYLREGCEHLGIALSPEEAEKKVRIAYQRIEKGR